MPPTRAKVYLWAELGALLGAVLAFPLAVGVLRLGIRVFGFDSLEDLARSAVIGLTTGALVLILGSSIGCWFALRKAGFPAARSAARMLFLLLVVFYLAAVIATKEGRVSVLVPAILIPFVMPPLATRITASVPRPAMIQTFVLLLVGLGAYGSFSRSSVVSLPVPVATPTVEEETPAIGQLPVGSENPCWAGTYPDDLAFLEAEEVPVRVFLVDPKANDIYYSDCVGRELSKGADWPPGVAERLVRSSDL
jgi:hypothetical protein